MGDNFLKQQIRNFEKSTDQAVDTLERAKLLERSEDLRTTYRAKPLVGESFEDGEKLFAVAVKDKPEIFLSRGHRQVGSIIGQGADALKEFMPGFKSILKVRVVAVSKVSNRATIEVLHE